MARKKTNTDNADDINYHKNERVVEAPRYSKQYDVTNVSNADLVTFTREELGLPNADSKYVYKVSKNQYVQLVNDTGKTAHSISSCISREDQLSVLKYLSRQYGGLFFYKLQFI